MITITSLQITTNATVISANVTTETGNTFTSLSLWDSTTYKDVSKLVDLTSLLSGSSNTEELSISLSDVDENLSAFQGIYILEFTDSAGNTQLGAVANLYREYQCLTDKIVDLTIAGCGSKVKPCCDDCNTNICDFTTLFYGVEIALKAGRFAEAVKIYNTIYPTYCDDCSSCPDYTDVQLVQGIGFGTYDNSIL